MKMKTVLPVSFVVALLCSVLCVNAHALTARRMCRQFAQKTLDLQLDGYKHLEYEGIFRQYCDLLTEEFKARNKSRCQEQLALKAVLSLKALDFADKDPFHVLEETIFHFDAYSGEGRELKKYNALMEERGFDVEMSEINKCDFTQGSLATDQICHHRLPTEQEIDPNRENLLLVSTGGRRTGMTKMIPLGTKIHEMLEGKFNVYSITVEAEMFSADEDTIIWKIAGTVKTAVDMIKSRAGGKSPKIILAGYSYGASHLIEATNHIFTRASFSHLEPDLLLFVDPDGSLNTLERLHLVPAAKRIVNFRGVYIVPQNTFRFMGKLLTKSLDKYPSVEGCQPLVLLRRANYKEVIVYESNGLDASPHNKVPHNLADFKDDNGNFMYLDIAMEEFKKLMGGNVV